MPRQIAIVGEGIGRMNRAGRGFHVRPISCHCRQLAIIWKLCDRFFAMIASRFVHDHLPSGVGLLHDHAAIRIDRPKPTNG